MNWPLISATLFTLFLLSLLHQFGHMHLRMIPIHLIGNNRVALWLYALIMLPGTLLHEASHALTAFALNVEVRDISISPSVQGDWVILGYVEHGEVSTGKHALIGLAPLIVGTLVILIICAATFKLGVVYNFIEVGDWPHAIALIVSKFGTWQGWVAATLVFIISSSMFPSPSDRKNWLPVGLFIFILLVLPLVVGIDLTIFSFLVRPINVLFQWLFLIFAFTLVVDFVFVLLLTAGHQAVAKQFP